jgi:hypothetical protein
VAEGESYGIFGVGAERKQHPAIKASTDDMKPRSDGAIGFARVDGQRLYKGLGGNISMGATPRLKNTGGGSVNKKSPGSFKGRRRTLSK